MELVGKIVEALWLSRIRDMIKGNFALSHVLMIINMRIGMAVVKHLATLQE